MGFQIIAYLVLQYISYLLQPRPKPPDPGKIEVPTVEEGRKIGVLFGGRWIRSPHVFWWGDTATTPIRAEGGKKG